MRKSGIIQFLINAAIFIILQIAALNILRSNGSLQDIWISKGAHTFISNVWGGTQRVKGYFSLGKANDELAIENFELRMRLAQLEHLADDAGERSDSMSEDVAGCFKYRSEARR